MRGVRTSVIGKPVIETGIANVTGIGRGVRRRRSVSDVRMKIAAGGENAMMVRTPTGSVRKR